MLFSAKLAAAVQCHDKERHGAASLAPGLAGAQRRRIGFVRDGALYVPVELQPDAPLVPEQVVLEHSGLVQYIYPVRT